MVRVRPYTPNDRPFVLGLAPRLTVGIPAWRDARLMRATAERWIDQSIARRGEAAEVFVAEDDESAPLGFASVADEVHFTGVTQAYIGELVVREEAEGHGVGTALVDACEAWARRRGHRWLALATGAANARALAFYRRRGFSDEDVKLVKLLDGPAPPAQGAPR